MGAKVNGLQTKHKVGESVCGLAEQVQLRQRLPPQRSARLVVS